MKPETWNLKPAPRKNARFRLLAERTVARLLSELPPDVRRHAESVGLAIEDEVPPALLADGIEPDTLGLFSGPSLRDPDAGWSDEAPLITLFLGPLRDYAGPDPAAFAEEVRRTYLHELGHYLGLEESDMPSRDLD